MFHKAAEDSVLLARRVRAAAAVVGQQSAKQPLMGTYARPSTDLLRSTSSLSALTCLADISLLEVHINRGLASPTELDAVSERACRDLDAA